MGTNYQKNRLNERIITAQGRKKIIKMYLDTPELIKFVREHASDYKTLNRKDVPSCITIDRRRSERYFSVYIEKFGNVRFDEVLRVFPLLPKSYLNE